MAAEEVLGPADCPKSAAAIGAAALEKDQKPVLPVVAVLVGAVGSTVPELVHASCCKCLRPMELLAEESVGLAAVSGALRAAAVNCFALAAALGAAGWKQAAPGAAAEVHCLTALPPFVQVEVQLAALEPGIEAAARDTASGAAGYLLML